jgi:hypothetical protein
MRHTMLFGVLCCASWATAAYGHHAFSTEFDVQRPVELRGKVTKVELINPHSWIHIEVVDKDGNAVVWMVTKASVPIGSELIVEGYQARDGSNRAVGRNLSFADGRELFFEGTSTGGAGQ